MHPTVQPPDHDDLPPHDCDRKCPMSESDARQDVLKDLDSGS